MGEVNEEILEIEKRIDLISKELKSILKDEIVLKYLSYVHEYEKLKSNRSRLIEKSRCEMYSSCNHIYITHYIEKDDCEGRIYKYHACIKCGLDDSINSEHRGYLLDNPLYSSMKNYLYFGKIRGYDTGIYYDNLPKAINIYNELKNNNQNLDEESLIELFKIIINKEKKEEEKVRKLKK